MISKGTKLYCQWNHEICETGCDFEIGMPLDAEVCFVNWQPGQTPIRRGDSLNPCHYCAVCGLPWLVLETILSPLGARLQWTGVLFVRVQMGKYDTWFWWQAIGEKDNGD